MTTSAPASAAAPEPEAEAENPWRLALEGTGAGIWDWDVVTDEQTHSPCWEQLLGYSGTELQQSRQEFSRRLHPDDFAMHSAAVQAHLEGRTPSFAVDVRLRCKDGNWKWLITRGVVVRRDADGRALRLIGTHTDISKRKQTEQELNDANALLQTALREENRAYVQIDPAEK